MLSRNATIQQKSPEIELYSFDERINQIEVAALLPVFNYQANKFLCLHCCDVIYMIYFIVVCLKCSYLQHKQQKQNLC